MVPYPINYEVLLQLINVFFLTGLTLLVHPLIRLIGYEINKYSVFFIMLPLSWNYIIINGYIDGAGLYYPYDIPSLTFFAAGIILFLKNRWLFFYPVFILGCLNRESACFIALGGFLLTVNIERNTTFSNIIKSNRKIIHHVFIQAIIWLTLRIILSYTFRNNPGEFFEKPHSMIEFISRIWTGDPHWAMHDPRLFLTLFAGIWIIPLILWKKLNGFAKRFMILGLIYLVVLIFRSNMMETRVFNELNVIISVCALCALNSRHVLKSNYE